MKYILLLFLFVSFSAYAVDKTECTVTRIVDGDTFVCKTASGSEKIRLIGVDTPEMKTGEGKLAKKFVAQMLHIGNKIELELDVQERGPYRRLLAYVYLKDGKMLNELLVKEGYAYVATYPPNVKYVETFKKAQEYARINNKGLWAYSTEE